MPDGSCTLSSPAMTRVSRVTVGLRRGRRCTSTPALSSAQTLPRPVSCVRRPRWGYADRLRRPSSSLLCLALLCFSLLCYCQVARLSRLRLPGPTCPQACDVPRYSATVAVTTKDGHVLPSRLRGSQQPSKTADKVEIVSRAVDGGLKPLRSREG